MGTFVYVSDTAVAFYSMEVADPNSLMASYYE